MNNRKLISIAMCTYNGERFIIKQLESLVNQSYKNLELIIVDDDSTDSTIEIIKKYALNDSRIKFFQNEYNLGFVKNFEKAISLCKGDYIALADQDDIWKLDKLEIFESEIKDNILIYSDAEIIDKNSNEQGRELIRPNGNLVSGKCNKAFLFYNCASGNTMMFKRELIDSILPIPGDFSFHDIWIAFIASTVSTVTYTDEALIYYRRYSEQVTKNIEKNYQSFFDRFRQKKEKKTTDARHKLINLKLLRELKFLDEEVKYLLDLLIKQAETYGKGYLNLELYKYLNANQDEVFAIKMKKKRARYVLRESMKLKLHMSTFFSF